MGKLKINDTPNLGLGYNHKKQTYAADQVSTFITLPIYSCFDLKYKFLLCKPFHIFIFLRWHIVVLGIRLLCMWWETSLPVSRDSYYHFMWQTQPSSNNPHTYSYCCDRIQKFPNLLRGMVMIASSLLCMQSKQVRQIFQIFIWIFIAFLLEKIVCQWNLGSYLNSEMFQWTICEILHLKKSNGLKMMTNFLRSCQGKLAVSFMDVLVWHLLKLFKIVREWSGILKSGFL